MALCGGSRHALQAGAQPQLEAAGDCVQAAAGVHPPVHQVSLTHNARCHPWSYIGMSSCNFNGQVMATTRLSLHQVGLA